jgi:hypothetical protein
VARELVEVELKWQGRRIDTFISEVDPDDPEDVNGLFRDAITHDPSSRNRRSSEYEIHVRRKRNGAFLFKYVGRSR